MSTKISNLSELAAADLAALDLEMQIDASAGVNGSKKMYAMAKALGLSKLLFFEDTGGDDAYVVSTGLSLSSLSAGFAFALKVTTANTAACTLAVDSVAATAIKVVDASGVRDPLTGEIAAGMTALLSYNGTYFILLNPATAVKKYVALLTQTGTNAPVATVLENTLGGTPVWSRDAVGDYIATLSGVFVDGKTIAHPVNIFGDYGEWRWTREDSIPPDVLRFYGFTTPSVFGDGWDSVSITITVYP